MSQECPHTYQYQWLYMGNCLAQRILSCVYCGLIIGYGATTPSHTPRMIQVEVNGVVGYYSECAKCRSIL